MDHEVIAHFQQEQLHSAAQAGDRSRVCDLLDRKYPINRFDEMGKTPLHYAVQCGHLLIVDQLIKAGANVNAHDERVAGNTPLSENSGKCSYEIAKRLVDAGADPTMPGLMRLTAVDRAAKRRDADATKIQKLLQEAVERRRA